MFLITLLNTIGLNVARSSSPNPTPYKIFICLKIVLFPDSPAPGRLPTARAACHCHAHTHGAGRTQQQELDFRGLRVRILLVLLVHVRVAPLLLLRARGRILRCARAGTEARGTRAGPLRPFCRRTRPCHRRARDGPGAAAAALLAQESGPPRGERQLARRGRARFRCERRTPAQRTHASFRDRASLQG